MKLFELHDISTELAGPKLDFDPLDDLAFFIRNDPEYYRREYYPLVAKLNDYTQAGKKCKDTAFSPCVKKAVKIYIKKFKIPHDANKIFTDDALENLAQKMFREELDHIEKEFKGDKE